MSGDGGGVIIVLSHSIFNKEEPPQLVVYVFLQEVDLKTPPRLHVFHNIKRGRVPVSRTSQEAYITDV